MSTRSWLPDYLIAFGALCEVFDDEEAFAWLRLPHEMMGGRRPVDLIAEGKVEKVLDVIAILADGAYA